MSFDVAPSGEVTTNKNAARCQVIESPIASPGNCGMCGTPKHPNGFVDPRLDFEFYGTLIFCADCALDLASVVGAMAPADYTELLEKYTVAIETVAALSSQLESMENLRVAILNYNNSFTVPPVNTVGSNVFSLVQPEKLNGTERVVDDPIEPIDSITEQTDSEPTESVSEQGPIDSPDVAGDDFLRSLGIDT